MSHILVRFLGEPSPLVSAEQERSSPAFTVEIIRGTTLYSSMSIGFLGVIPLIFIASLIAPASSLTVGKKRNTTDNGIVILSVMCIFFIEPINSLTDVVVIRKNAAMTQGVNLVMIADTISTIKPDTPFPKAPQDSSNTNPRTYKTKYKNPVKYLADRSRRTNGIRARRGFKYSVSPLLSVLSMRVHKVINRNNFVLGSNRISFLLEGDANNSEAGIIKSPLSQNAFS